MPRPRRHPRRQWMRRLAAGANLRRMSRQRTRSWGRRTLWGAGIVLGALAISVLALRLWLHYRPPLPLAQWLPSSTAVLDAQGNLLRLTLASDQQYRLWTPLPEIAPTLVQAILLHEDRYFYWEPGFNPFSLLRGAFRTYVLRQHPQGGSTITMQLARLLWRLDTRTPQGKLVQIARAVQLELMYSKNEILTAYLNDAPFGGNVQGVGAASWIYFAHAPAELTLPEALTLAVLPQNPSLRGKIDQGRANPALVAARNRLFARWQQVTPVSAAESALFRLPLSMRSTANLPFEAPWFVDQVLAQQALSSAQRPNDWLRTTLDLRLQRLLSRQLKAFVRQRRGQGIQNAAALLVDTRDMGVKAMVGSADYFNAAIDGQVNGTNAKRSPGSALKPFIYGLGFDQGVLIPATVLRDVPTAFGPYHPENFDGRFEGPITATQALIRSRNIPAVDVAARLDHPSFYDFLRTAGVANMAPESRYGLALVLGGGEVTMQEMARLYALLANDGELKPLRFLQQTPVVREAPQLLSAAACYMVRDILQRNPSPLLAPTSQPSRLPVAWKTGTSSSFRDAWSAGLFGPYVLIVWVGNFDGSPNPALVGGDVAAPLFFNLINAVRASTPALVPLPDAVPARLKRVEVCLSSGALPTVWCPRRGMSWFIPGVSPITVDTVYRPVWVDKTTGKAVCPPYDLARDERRVYEFWPSELQQVFAAAGIPRTPPLQAPDCRDTTEGGSAPRITSPLIGSVYAQRLSDAAHDRIALTADTDADVRRLYWFADRSYLGSSSPEQPLFWTPQQPGSYTVTAVDDHGRADSRAVRIARLP